MRKNNNGFTLIEVLVTMFIISLLAVIVMPKILGRTEEAQIVKTKAQINLLESALQLYKLDNGEYPSTEQGLEALVVKPSVGHIPSNWQEGGYLEKGKIPLDPWGNPYIYISPGLHDEYDIESYGADKEDGGEGKYADIESWNLE